MIMSFEVFKNFTSGKINFFLFASLRYQNLKLKKTMLFSEILTHSTVGLIEKGLFFHGKMLTCDWNLPYLEVKEIYK